MTKILIKIKHLLSSLSLIFGGISIGAIAASCATPSSSEDTSTNSQVSQQLNNPNNPSSPNSIITNPGESLKESQIEYHTKLAKSIRAKFDNYSKLNYKNKADSQKLDQLLKMYREQMKNGPLQDFLDKISFSDWNNSVKKAKEDFYKKFKQKNLLPTLEEIKENAPLHDPIAIASNLSLIYSDPESIIFINQLVFLKGFLWRKDTGAVSLNKDLKSFYDIYSFSKDLSKGGGVPIMKTNQLSYQIFQLYYPFLYDLRTLSETID